MNIFIAGGSGAIGRALVPMLVRDVHRVVALSRTAQGADRLAAMGAVPVTGDVFDAGHLTELVAQAKPQIVIHQLTAFGATDADPLAETIRVRIEGTRCLVAAASAAGARRFVAQSISFICTPGGDGLTDEDTPLYLSAPPAIRPLAHSIAELERQVLHASGMLGVGLRYGWFHGPGTNYAPDGVIPRTIRKGRMALVGSGAGTYSFVDVADATKATLNALDCAPGIYNIVDDEPARLRDLLPLAAKLLGGPEPTAMDEALAREKLGDMMVYLFNEQSGASNRKAKQVPGWRPDTPSWRTGFERLYAAR